MSLAASSPNVASSLFAASSSPCTSSRFSSAATLALVASAAASAAAAAALVAAPSAAAVASPWRALRLRQQLPWPQTRRRLRAGQKPPRLRPKLRRRP